MIINTKGIITSKWEFAMSGILLILAVHLGYDKKYVSAITSPTNSHCNSFLFSFCFY